MTRHAHIFLAAAALAVTAACAYSQTVTHGKLPYGLRIDTNLFNVAVGDIVTTPGGTLTNYATRADLAAAANAATNHSAANLNAAVGHADSLTNALWLAIGEKQGRLPYPTNAIPAAVIVGGTDETDPVWTREKSGYLPLTGGRMEDATISGIYGISGSEAGEELRIQFDSHSTLNKKDGINWYYGGGEDEDEIAVKGDLAGKVDKSVIHGLDADAKIGDIVEKINQIAGALGGNDDE